MEEEEKQVDVVDELDDDDTEDDEEEKKKGIYRDQLAKIYEVGANIEMIDERTKEAEKDEKKKAEKEKRLITDQDMALKLQLQEYGVRPIGQEPVELYWSSVFDKTQEQEYNTIKREKRSWSEPEVATACLVKTKVRIIKKQQPAAVVYDNPIPLKLGNKSYTYNYHHKSNFISPWPRSLRATLDGYN